MHTCVYAHTHTHTQSLLTPNFVLSPNFRGGAEVNTSTIKAFFEQNRSIILWVSRIQILISLLNSASSPLRREREMEKNGKSQYSKKECFTKRERHFLRGLWFTQIKQMVSTAVEAGGRALSPRLKKYRCPREAMELSPACPASSRTPPR